MTVQGVRGLGSVFGILCGCLGLILVGGCPTSTIPNAPGTPTTPGGGGAPAGEDAGQIINVRTGFPVSELANPISVLYSFTGTADTLDGYYVPVSGPESTAGPVGSRVFIAPSLEMVTDGRFDFDPGLAGQGFYKVGIRWIVGGQEFTAESEGVIQVEGGPNPQFQQPSGTIQVVVGTDVPVRFDVGDPEGNVQWRLFYLSDTDSRDLPPDQLGTEIATGTGNLCPDCVFSTAGLAPGNYELGLAATDSGFSVATTVSRGEADQVVVIPQGAVRGPIVRVLDVATGGAPSLTFATPTTAGVELFCNETFTVEYSV
ncbi:MAG: hypothetical protein D6788_08600, partial [Planctomycetota bacterium]